MVDGCGGFRDFLELVEWFLEFGRCRMVSSSIVFCRGIMFGWLVVCFLHFLVCDHRALLQSLESSNSNGWMRCGEDMHTAGLAHPKIGACALLFQPRDLVRIAGFDRFGRLERLRLHETGSPCKPQWLKIPMPTSHHSDSPLKL